MKLKKIASLMLAGVMAVSMLAGCSTGKADPEPTPNPDPTPAAGYSDVLAENLSDDAKKDYITYEDNADDIAALEDALGNLSSTSLADKAILPKTVTPIVDVLTTADMKLVINDFANSAKIDNDNLSKKDAEHQLLRFFHYGFDSADAKYGLLYVIDGTVDENKALAQVASKIESSLERLPNVNADNVARVTYDYTVSASVVNKALEPFAGYTLSANFIAVTITRTATQL